jgi:hypothetical protein
MNNEVKVKQATSPAPLSTIHVDQTSENQPLLSAQNNILPESQQLSPFTPRNTHTYED